MTAGVTVRKRHRNETMRILYLANYRLPTEKAHGIQIVKMCEAFADAGADLTLAYPDRITEISGTIFDYYGVRRKFGVEQLQVRDFVDRVPLGFLWTSILFMVGAIRHLRRTRYREWVYC